MIERGYDIDGVLTIGIAPIAPYVVISGRLALIDWARTITEIGTAAPIYLRPIGQPGDKIACGHWKAEIINKFGITTFYEDEPVQAAVIKEYCPQCTIILVQADGTFVNYDTGQQQK